MMRSSRARIIRTINPIRSLQESKQKQESKQEPADWSDEEEMSLEYSRLVNYPELKSTLILSLAKRKARSFFAVEHWLESQISKYGSSARFMVLQKMLMGARDQYANAKIGSEKQNLYKLLIQILEKFQRMYLIQDLTKAQNVISINVLTKFIMKELFVARAQQAGLTVEESDEFVAFAREQLFELNPPRVEKIKKSKRRSFSFDEEIELPKELALIVNTQNQIAIMLAHLERVAVDLRQISTKIQEKNNNIHVFAVIVTLLHQVLHEEFDDMYNHAFSDADRQRVVLETRDFVITHFELLSNYINQLLTESEMKTSPLRQDLVKTQNGLLMFFRPEAVAQNAAAVEAKVTEVKANEAASTRSAASSIQAMPYQTKGSNSLSQTTGSMESANINYQRSDSQTQLHKLFEAPLATGRGVDSVVQFTDLKMGLCAVL